MYRDSTRSLRVLSCISIRLSYANLIGIREMSERANDQLAYLIGSDCNGHMQAGIASVTPDLRHIRLFPEDWPLSIFCWGGGNGRGEGRSTRCPRCSPTGRRDGDGKQGRTREAWEDFAGRHVPLYPRGRAARPVS